MKNCPHCNTLMEDNAFYCPACGQRMSEPAAAPADSEAFHVFRRNLRHERKCWSIAGWVWIGITAFFNLYLFSVAGIAGLASEESLAFGIVAAMALLYDLLIFIPITAVQFVMKSKLDKYVAQIETDPEPAKRRAGSVGSIVLGALFNEVALIFVILNFIHVKRNGNRIQK